MEFLIHKENCGMEAIHISLCNDSSDTIFLELIPLETTREISSVLPFDVNIV